MFSRAGTKECVIYCVEGFVSASACPNTCRHSITQAQADWFLKIVRDNNHTVMFGNVPKLVANVKATQFDFRSEMKSPLGMHMVEFDYQISLYLPIQPDYNVDKVKEHRKCMSCDCYTYHQMTWLCEHVLLSCYHLLMNNNSHPRVRPCNCGQRLEDCY